MSRWISTICILFLLSGAHAQSLKLRFVLADEDTKTVIAGAHVFVDNSSIGTISGDDGNVLLEIGTNHAQSLILSHINYETAVVLFENFKAILPGDTILMQSNGILIDEVNIVSERGRKWKKNFKKFRRGFLGEGRPASKCKILNPEVLRFRMEGEVLHTTAVNLIEISNKHLGYNISFLLEAASIEDDGASTYRGFAKFQEIEGMKDKKMEKLREKYYVNSLQHFLLSLIQSADEKVLKQRGYKISVEKYAQGNFKPLYAAKPSELVSQDSSTGNYRLQFSDFLTVEHLNIEDKSSARQVVSVSGAEQQKFGADRTQDMSSGNQPVLSRLYKIEEYLLFNSNGVVVNKAASREYGYWANQRLSTTLPYDYRKIEPFVAIDRKVVDTLQIFIDFIGENKDARSAAFEFFDQHWSDEFVAPLFDIMRMSGAGWHSSSVSSLLQKHVPKIKPQYFSGLQNLWKQPSTYGLYYSDFKAELYKRIDPAFARYFQDRASQSEIRIDEVVWGGVKQDGIPPLRKPKMIEARAASYLDDGDQIFGIVIGGRAYAYPQRILAWHEFFTDEIDEVPIAGVYCTLCGSVVIYNTRVDGEVYDLGTSGFLYRSNKLMYDKATQSLWSMLLGKPVIGPLVAKDIELSVLPVETTDWASWVERFPDTKVLSDNTGYDRDYGTGVAYKNYYASDRLMFPVPLLDERLDNKARIFVPRIEGYETDPLGITVDFLKKNRLYEAEINDTKVLILTDGSSGSRAYHVGTHTFQAFEDGILVDKEDRKWEVGEDFIKLEGMKFPRLPAHEVFWFAWVNTFPSTRLVR